MTNAERSARIPEQCMRALRILIADDEEPARFALRRALNQTGCEILEAADGVETLEMLRTELPDLLFLDLQMPKRGGIEILRELCRPVADCEIIVLTANDNIASAVECIRLGASDFINKPYEIEQVRSIVRRVAQRLELQNRVLDLQNRLDHQHGCGQIVGVSRPMRHLFERMSRVASTDVDLLIRGETGTGKELIAREIHRLSNRSAGPFVAVNTAAIPESLTESELFGHVRGAFTGADSNRTGIFEQAHGGTLFLDEIGDMPLAAQTKILRALQERVIRPLGSERILSVNVRIISATHQNLEEAITNGRFRQDLFYRLKGVELQIPPLRTRREDILVLANEFLDRWAKRMNASTPEFSPTAIDAMLAHRWPGNVRELEQSVTSAATMADQSQIEPFDIGLMPSPSTSDESSFAAYVGLPLSEAKSQLIESLERTLITAALSRTQGNVSEAARQLGMHRQSLQQKMTQLGISR